MNIRPIHTRLFEENEALVPFILKHIRSIKDGDILAITSKILALSQGRTAPLDQKENLIRREARKIIETPWALLAFIDNEWVINAGVDESNADGKIILLPLDPQASARTLRTAIMKKLSLKKLGIIITDTRSVPLRAGTVGRAIGYAGFEPFRSYKGATDLFGRKSRYTESNVADALATAAVLEMGEGDERSPLALIKAAPAIFTSKKINSLLSFPAEQDIFSYVFESSGKKKPRG